MANKEHIVYSYTFSKDGAQYFGHTTKDRLEDRKKEHRDGDEENEVLQHRLQEGYKYSFDDRVSEHETKDQAKAEEDREIASAPKVINNTGAPNSIYEEELEKIKKGLA